MSYTKFHCNIKIEHNTLKLDINDYLDVALRNNNKRRFLFVSKNLGKHIPTDPNKVDELGQLLAKAYKLKYSNYSKEKQFVIGFAETATCLAHSFFDYLESAQNFVHTTREVMDLEKLEFEEEHSHATEQILYKEALNKNIESSDTIVLVDDEITTAKTCINMIKKLNGQYNIDKFVIASLLNWIDSSRLEHIMRTADELNCKIEFVYLFNGSFEFEFDEKDELRDIIQDINEERKADIEINNIKLDFKEYCHQKKYLKYTGRFGIDREDQEKLKVIIQKQAQKLNDRERDYKVLALGSEEFMYIPMMLSKEINGQVYYHSITRSPIIPIKEENYPIKSKYKFTSFNNSNVTYLYNLDVNNYKECFLFIETYTEKKKIDDFIETIKSLGIKKINIVSF